MALCNRMASSRQYTPAQLSSLCHLFCSIVELGMTAVKSFLEGARLNPYAKSCEDGAFKWPHGSRKSAAAHYNAGIAMDEQRVPKEVQNRLWEMVDKWMPYKDADGQSLWYTRLSYAFHAIRHVRNVGTHRCLRLYRATGAPAGSNADDPLGSDYSRVVWLPYSPAASLYTGEIVRKAFTFLDDCTPEVRRERGYGFVEARAFVEEVQFAAGSILKDLKALVNSIANCMLLITS